MVNTVYSENAFVSSQKGNSKYVIKIVSFNRVQDLSVEKVKRFIVKMYYNERRKNDSLLIFRREARPKAITLSFGFFPLYT